MHLSNTYHLISVQGWSGVLIEADSARYQALVRNMSGFGAVRAICSQVRDLPPDTLDAILSRTPIPEDLDLLSIDVDNDDYLIWRSCRRYRPRVVVIEVNSSYPPGIAKIPLAGYDGPNERKRGASIGSMVELARQKGYELALHLGNAIFVRQELAQRLDIEPERWPELFDAAWIRKPHQQAWDGFRRWAGGPYRRLRTLLRRSAQG